MRVALAAPVAARAGVAAIPVATVVVATGAEIAKHSISTPFRRVALKGPTLQVKIMGFIQFLNNLKIQ